MQRIRSRLSDSLLMPEVRERTQHETERHASPQALLAFARIPPFTQVLLLMLMPPTARRLPVPASTCPTGSAPLLAYAAAVAAFGGRQASLPF